MIRNKISNYLKFKKSMSNYDNLLVSGFFKFNFVGKPMFYINNNKNKDFLYKNERSKRMLVPIINSLLGTIFNKRIRSENGSFDADLIMMSREEDLKFFSNKQQKIINLYKNTKRIEIIKNNHKKFQKYFNTSIIKFGCNYSTEIYIKNIQTRCLTARLENAIIIDLLENIKKQTASTFKNSMSFRENIVSSYIYPLSFKELKLINYDIPIILTHGDLNFDNVVIDNAGNIFYLDLEDVGHRSFLYDFLNIIFVESLWQNNNNQRLFKRYLAGEFDKKLVEIFEQFNVDVKLTIKNKFYIFNVFLLERYFKYDIFVFEDKNNLVEKYEQIISKTKLIFDCLIDRTVRKEKI